MQSCFTALTSILLWPYPSLSAEQCSSPQATHLAHILRVKYERSRIFVGKKLSRVMDRLLFVFVDDVFIGDMRRIFKEWMTPVQLLSLQGLVFKNLVLS